MVSVGVRGCTVRCVFGGCDSERLARGPSALRWGQGLPPLFAAFLR